MSDGKKSRIRWRIPAKDDGQKTQTMNIAMPAELHRVLKMRAALEGIDMRTLLIDGYLDKWPEDVEAYAKARDIQHNVNARKARKQKGAKK